jgi:hypothetical protein
MTMENALEASWKNIAGFLTGFRHSTANSSKPDRAARSFPTLPGVTHRSRLLAVSGAPALMGMAETPWDISIAEIKRTAGHGGAT